MRPGGVARIKRKAKKNGEGGTGTFPMKRRVILDSNRKPIEREKERGGSKGWKGGGEVVGGENIRMVTVVHTRQNMTNTPDIKRGGCPNREKTSKRDGIVPPGGEGESDSP